MADGSTFQSKVALALVVVATLAAGCVSDHPPRTFVTTGVEPSFAGDLLFLNVTVKNIGNHTLGGANSSDLTVWPSLKYFRYDPNSTGPSLRSEHLQSSQQVRLAGFQTEEKRPIYYDTKALDAMGVPSPLYKGRSLNPGYYGPIMLEPGQEERITFAFKLLANYSRDEGYYYVFMQTFGGLSGYDVGTVLYTGCFNADIPPFYGVKEGQHDCPYFDLTGRWTEEWMKAGFTPRIPPCNKVGSPDRCAPS